MIKILIMDVDGTLTDGKIYISENGEEFKAFNAKDGYGIKLLLSNNIIPIVMTGRTSKIVENRCKELRITNVYQGVINKIEKLERIIEERKVSLDNIAYIGDDLPDFECIKKIKNGNGLTGCPNDAVTELINMCDFISSKNGGTGAVRDFIDWIIKEQNNENNRGNTSKI